MDTENFVSYFCFWPNAKCANIVFQNVIHNITCIWHVCNNKTTDKVIILSQRKILPQNIWTWHFCRCTFNHSTHLDVGDQEHFSHGKNSVPCHAVKKKKCWPLNTPDPNLIKYPGDSWRNHGAQRLCCQAQHHVLVFLRPRLCGVKLSLHYDRLTTQHEAGGWNVYGRLVDMPKKATTKK